MKWSVILTFLVALVACVGGGSVTHPTPAPAQSICFNCTVPAGQGPLSVSPTTLTFATTTSPTQTLTLTDPGYAGAYTCVSGNTAIATVSLASNVCTVTPVGIGTMNIAVSDGTTTIQVPTTVQSGGTAAAATPSPIPNNAANTLWVATNGSDSNPGTNASPYLTIEKCATVVTAAQTCAIKDGTYTATSSSNTGLCAVACLAFLTHAGSAGNTITFQSQNYQAVTLSGTSPATGAGYAFVLGNSVRYINFNGFICQNFKFGCVQGNAGSGGASFGNDHLTFTGNNCNNLGLTCLLGGAYASDVTITNNYIDFIGSYSGFSSCPASNANDHGFYLQAPRQVIENNVFGPHINCGWDIQLADDTPSQPTTGTVVGNSFGARNPVGGTNVPGNVVLYEGTQGVTPSVTWENNISYNSVGAYVHCFSQTVAGNPTITISYNLTGDANALIDCLGTYTYNHTGNVLNQSPGFLVTPPVNQSDFEIHNTSQACNLATPVSGWLTDILGIARPNLFTNPDSGAYSCNNY